MGDSLIANHDFALGRYDEAGKNFEQRGFPGSILSRQSMDFAGLELEAQIVQRANAREITGEVLNRDRGEAVQSIFSVVIIHRASKRTDLRAKGWWIGCNQVDHKNSCQCSVANRQMNLPQASCSRKAV